MKFAIAFTVLLCLAASQAVPAKEAVEGHWTANSYAMPITDQEAERFKKSVIYDPVSRLVPSLSPYGLPAAPAIPVASSSIVAYEAPVSPLLALPAAPAAPIVGLSAVAAAPGHAAHPIPIESYVLPSSHVAPAAVQVAPAVQSLALNPWSTYAPSALAVEYAAPLSPYVGYSEIDIVSPARAIGYAPQSLLYI